MYKTICLMILALSAVIFTAMLSNERQFQAAAPQQETVSVAGPVSEEQLDVPSHSLPEEFEDLEPRRPLSWNRAAALLFMGAYSDS